MTFSLPRAQGQVLSGMIFAHPRSNDMKAPGEGHEGLRAVSGYLAAGEILGSLAGGLLLLTSFGICGPTAQFDVGLRVLLMSSTCMGVNLWCLKSLKARGEKDLEALVALAWLGAPGLLFTLMGAGFWVMIHFRW